MLPEYLGTSTIERLREHTGQAHTVIVVGAGPGVADALGELGGGASIPLDEGRESGCDDPRFDGLTLEVDFTTLYPHGDCFDGKAGAIVTEPADGLLLFGADQALTNDQILRADNAAVALRLLGQDERLVWYVPSIDDLVGDDGVSLQTLLPRWVRPGLALLAIVMVTVILWRARRLGALATEPLPVVVRAVETTRSLGRLYRRSGDRDHAAESLRRAARSRLAERLRLGSTDPTRRPGPRGGPAHRPHRGRRRGRPRPGRRRTVLGPRPDHPGQAADRARQRGTPHMTDAGTSENGQGPHASGSSRCAPRSARPWSARTPRSPACSSRCCAAATC